MAIKQYSLAKDGARQLAPGFKVREFRCRDGSDVVMIDESLVMLLQCIREHFGKPITITSGYRTAAHNAAVGGAKSSQHLLGRAADIQVAGVFHASPKSRTGALESRAGWKGLIRKGETLLIVLVACRLDAVMATSFVRDAVVIGFICNETISIVENAGLMGLPIPAALTKAVDILKQRSEEQKGT